MDKENVNFEIRSNDEGFMGVFAKRALEKGTVIYSFNYASGNILNKPTKRTVQIGENEHIDDDILGFLNHSCEPNLHVDLDSYSLRMLSNVEKNDELTFFYPSTELQMVEPFYCNCGNNLCLGTVYGALFLDEHTIKNHKELFSRFVLSKIY